MARQVRIEFPGAIYHVNACGDRRELIVRDDEDRRTFVRTLGECCERAGFRVHARVAQQAAAVAGDDMGFSLVGFKDNAGGRREFLGLLEKCVDWRKPSHAGLSFPELKPEEQANF